MLKHIVLVVIGYAAARRLGRGPSTRELTRPEDPADVRKRDLKTFGKRLATLIPVLGVVGFLIAASGIIPLKASSRHWPITAWFLNFTMDRSVVLHSVGIKAPPLDDPVLILKGAGHYDNGCRPCHGAPPSEQPKIPFQMTPFPPNLSVQVPIWEPEELFYIVKHGMKFTGMPAWPTQSRDDEIWAMVAFLMRLPEMGVDEYTTLVEGPTMEAPGGGRPDSDAVAANKTASPDDVSLVPDTRAFDEPNAAEGTASPDTKVAASAPVEGLVRPQGTAGGDVPIAVTERCGRCHGLRGEGREIGAFPRLAGQRPHYMFATLRAYAEGERNSGIMQPIAAALTEEEMREIAFYYSRLGASGLSQTARGLVAAAREDTPAAAREDTDAVAREDTDADAREDTGADAREDAAAVGREEIAPFGGVDSAAVGRGERIAREGIPNERVPSCADCHGPGHWPRNPFYPELAGQFSEYIELQLELFKDEHRGGSVYARLMHPTADDLTEQQMRDVAHYYASLGSR